LSIKFQALENDMPALSKLCAQQYFYYILGREDLSKEIVQMFIKGGFQLEFVAFQYLILLI
jgi:hypothetical protein